MSQGIFRKRTRCGNSIIQTYKGLLEDSVWKFKFCPYPIDLLCSIRKELAEKIPRLAEKFHPQLRYFGYRVGADKEKAYIYVLKNKLIIDLCVDLNHVKKLEEEGFDVKPRNNFQAKRGWLTGWQIPRSTIDIKPIVKWLYKALKDEGDEYEK